MCGIAGVVWDGPNAVTARALLRAADTLSHRGPDDAGVIGIAAADGARSRIDAARQWKPVVKERPADRLSIGLVHRRLSIIDTSFGGHQPMMSPECSVTLVFNGEIYNYRELREQLTALGHQFASGSDTEVLMHAYLEWGRAMVDRLIGMWAFAIVDLRTSELVLCRDPFGIKPLYYALPPGGGIAFASEPKAIHALLGTRPTVDAAEAFRFLRWGETDSAEDHLSAGIRQLMPGHFGRATLDAPGALELRAYWRPEDVGRRSMRLPDAAAELRELFRESVRLHLRSDVPLAFSLSGGIDSSAIVCESGRQVGDQTALTAYSYIPDDPALSEAPWIDLVTSVSPVDRRDVRMRSQDMWGQLRELVRIQDAPVGSSRIVAHAEVVAQAARDGFKVMLKGQGADELFAGYFYFFGARLADLVLRGQFADAVQLARRSAALPGWGMRKSLAWAVSTMLPESMVGPLARAAGRGRVLPWIKMDWFRARGVSGTRDDSEYARDVLKHALADSIARTSLPHLLRYEDRNSMAVSLECRVPFLTTPLAEFALSAPDELLLSNDGWTKFVLRHALAGIVPEKILWRSDKVGFETPERDWLRDIDAELLLGPRAGWRSTDLVDWDLLLTADGKLAAPSRSLDAQQIFRSCALEMWMQEADATT